jgi:hypothetical protein
MYHQLLDGQLIIWVPSVQQQRRMCYRLQLPKLLATILNIDQSAVFDISEIIKSNPRELDDVLVEQDIPAVSWIEKPVTNMSESEEGEHQQPSRPTSEDSDVATLVDENPSQLKSEIPIRRGRKVSQLAPGEQKSSQHGKRTDSVMGIAQQSSNES